MAGFGLCFYTAMNLGYIFMASHTAYNRSSGPADDEAAALRVIHDHCWLEMGRHIVIAFLLALGGARAIATMYLLIFTITLRCADMVTNTEVGRADMRTRVQRFRASQAPLLLGNVNDYAAKLASTKGK